MAHNKLSETSDLLLHFLSSIKNDFFIDNNFIKNFSLPPKEFQECMSDVSIPPSHVKVILYLERVKSSPISQIANKLNISKSNMTPIIDNLIELDLVKRYPDKNDRRILRVELTPKALDLFKLLENAAREIIKSKISSLSDNDLNALYDSLNTLSNILNKIDNN